MQLVRVGAADQRFRLLVVQLEDLDVVEHVADVRIRPERPDLGGAHEALKVDEELPAAGIERGEGGWRKVGPRQRAHVDPDCVGGRLDCLVGRPGIADGVLPHDPLLSLVVEAVLGRGRRLVPRDRQAERLERGE